MRNPTLPGWQPWDNFVPKVWAGLRGWTAEGPIEVPIALPRELGVVYQWRGRRLVCVGCPDAERR
jgi:hypothetical protein